MQSEQTLSKQSADEVKELRVRVSELVQILEIKEEKLSDIDAQNKRLEDIDHKFQRAQRLTSKLQSNNASLREALQAEREKLSCFLGLYVVRTYSNEWNVSQV